tara:strand:+ start:690 stop:2471 length:1782 start_codon:yes stop_codon:yes gene_type:complete
MPIAEDVHELEDGWKLATVPHLIGGINTDLPDHLIGESQVPAASNVAVRDGRLVVDTGYAKLGATVRGVPRLVWEYLRTTELIDLLLVTNLTVYKWDTTQLAWHYISNGTSTTLTAEAAAAATSLIVTSISGFADGEFIGVILDDGTEHQTSVNGTPTGSTIVIDDAIPAGRTAPNGAAVVEAVLLAGDDALVVDGADVPSQPWAVFVNGVDAPFRYDGTDVQDVPNLPSGGNFIARTVALYNNYLLFGYCTEGGTVYPYRIRRPDTGDPTNWSTGNAGFDDLLDYSTPIRRLMNLGPYCICYREANIVRGTAVNTATKIIEWETVVTGEGLVAGNAVADVGEYHVFLGKSNVNRYDGGFSVQGMAEPYYSGLMSASGALNPEYVGRSHAVYVDEIREVWIIYPGPGETYPKQMARLNLAQSVWMPRSLTDAIAGVGTNRKALARPWNSLAGSWLAQSWKWNARALQANSPVIVLCGADINQVWEYDFVAGDDDGTALVYSVETKDFFDAHKDLRFDALDFLIKGSSITLSFSLDGGGTWTTADTVSPGVSWQRVRTTINQVAKTIRFRWDGTANSFQLGWFGFIFREESNLP